MDKTYKWNKKEILLKYLQCLKHILDIRNTNKQEDFFDRDYLADMIDEIIGKSYHYSRFNRYLSLERDLHCDEEFINEKTTVFQRKKIEKIIEVVLNDDFLYINELLRFKNNKNDILMVKEFLKNINSLLYYELNTVIESNGLYVDEVKINKECAYGGSCFSLKDKNYYQIILDDYNSLFLTLNHENVHGLINKLSNRKFDRNKTLRLYREVGSILIEMYGNEYLYKNNLIDEEHYIYNYNSIYLINMYDQIELIDFLYKISRMSFKKNVTNMKKIINQEIKLRPNYDFKLEELTELPLEHYLIYLYSAAIAISLFDMYKEEPKKGMDAAIDIMLNIDENNEKEIFEKYNIEIETALDSFKKKNNYLVKKRNN